MSLPERWLDPDPDYIECEHHHWVYPLGSACQACVRDAQDAQDEYADQRLQDRMDAR